LLLKSSRNFKATTNFAEAISFSDNIFVVVATPTDPVYGYDHSQVENIIEKIIPLGKQKTLKHWLQLIYQI
jgi:UDP-glucose 6-dehydrogenase